MDYVLLAGYLKLIPGGLCRAFKRRILNIHPGLLPSFGGKGYFGSKVGECRPKVGMLCWLAAAARRGVREQNTEQKCWCCGLAVASMCRQWRKLLPNQLPVSRTPLMRRMCPALLKNASGARGGDCQRRSLLRPHDTLCG